MLADLFGIAVAGGLALSAIGWRIRKRRYELALRIPARRSDVCICRADRPAVPISLRADGFELPAEVSEFRGTAFLAFDVEATSAGQLWDPFIELQCEGTRYRQYFERSAAGRRYLNLSPAFEARDPGSAVRISLRGHRIRWRADGSLVLFDRPRMDDASALVLAPHPDDAEIAAFGLYSACKSWIVTVTSGERGISSAPSVDDPSGAINDGGGAALRLWDSLYIPALGNVAPQRCVNLVYPDGEIKAMHDDPARPFRIACEARLGRRQLRSKNNWAAYQHGASECRWRDLVQEIGQLLDDTKPRFVVCPHPLLDSHPDHVFSSVALAEALRGGSYRPELCFMYVVHAAATSLHPFGPADGIISIPPVQLQAWVADSLYSHAVSEDIRWRKFCAVEAAHGLREIPDQHPRTIRRSWRTLKRRLAASISGLGSNPGSQLRRAPRPNELYFLTSVDGFLELARRAQTP